MQKVTLNSMVVGTRQSFQFFRQTTWFLESNGALSKILYEILYYLISIIQQYRNQSIKPNLILTTWATLSNKLLLQVGGFRSTVRIVLLIAIPLESLNLFKALSKKPTFALINTNAQPHLKIWKKLLPSALW